MTIVAFIAWSCSPKLRPVAVVPVKEVVKPKSSQPAVIPVKPAAPKVSTISLLLPFDLDHLRSGSIYTSISLKEADLSLDYYRGFKLALDSLTGSGYNYKLVVYDSKGEVAQAHSLANNPAIRAGDLIVGPVFPDDLKAFTSTYANPRQPIVSPLSPAPPSTYKNPKVVTMLPPLEYHAWGAARYIIDHLKPKVIFILKSGYSDENEYIVPFKRAIDSLSKNRTKIVYLTVIHGQLHSLFPRLSASAKNIFVVPATNQHFLTVTLRALDTVSTIYPVTLFGHPDWINLSFLKADLLQRLDTHVTSADHIDYKSPGAVSFSKVYRQAYHLEPTGYAIKGFDEGLYLGKLAATDSLANFALSGFTGVHNDFHFQQKAGQGWINTHINVYKYANFELEKGRMKAINQLKTFRRILDEYPADTPLSKFLPGFYRQNKQMGSTDRRIASRLIYNYFRLGKALPGTNVEERLSVAEFLCNTQINSFLQYLKPEWVASIALPIAEKLGLIKVSYRDFNLDDVFPWTTLLSPGIDKTAFLQSFFIQPDLFIRVQKKFEHQVKDALITAEVVFDDEGGGCLSLPNGIKLETLLPNQQWYQVQDFSSQQTSRFFKPQKWDYWWDACAASGGKSLLLHDLEPTIKLVVSDIRESVLNNLDERFRQAGLLKYQKKILDLTQNNDLLLHDYVFDGIILDAPCSGSGTWGRSPEMISQFDDQKIIFFQQLQKKIAANVVKYLKPGKPLIFVTCSVFKAENDDMVDFLVKDLGLKLEDRAVLKGYEHRADTMFAARLIR